MWRFYVLSQNCRLILYSIQGYAVKLLSRRFQSSNLTNVDIHIINGVVFEPLRDLKDFQMHLKRTIAHFLINVLLKGLV